MIMGKNRLVEPQVRYSCRRSRLSPEGREYFFLIVAHNREIPIITDSIYNMLAMTYNHRTGYEGGIEGTGGLRYTLINFDSRKRLEDGWEHKIFKRVIKDRDLYRRSRDKNALEIYIADLKWVD